LCLRIAEVLNHFSVYTYASTSASKSYETGMGYIPSPLQPD
jgi:hypothetical protein